MKDGGLQTAQRIIGAWARQQFPQQTTGGIIAHLMEELRELAQSTGTDALAEEAADIAILLLALADHEGFCLYEALAAKHAVNTRRRWGPTDTNGIHHHAKPRPRSEAKP